MCVVRLSDGSSDNKTIVEGRIGVWNADEGFCCVITEKTYDMRFIESKIDSLKIRYFDVTMCSSM